MQNATKSIYEQEVFEFIQVQDKYKNYDIGYCKIILGYAQILNDEYGGDIDVIVSVIVCKYLSDQFFDLRNESIVDVEVIFEHINIDKKKQIIITDLCKGNIDSLESKIVSDSIYLAMFGVRGFTRIFVWYGYLSVTVNINDIKHKYNEVSNKIVFQMSKNIVFQKWKLLFHLFDLYSAKPTSEQVYQGKYIVIEGNSGTGKNTQVKLLEDALLKKGWSVKVIDEPTTLYRNYEEKIKKQLICSSQNLNNFFRLFAILGDRYEQIYNVVNSELEKGNIVLSCRSYLSMFVYQCETDEERRFINYLHSFVPKPDLVIIFDGSIELCVDRVQKRNRQISYFDKRSSLEKYRPIYLELKEKSFLQFPIEIIDISTSIQEIFDKTFTIVKKYLGDYEE